VKAASKGSPCTDTLGGQAVQQTVDGSRNMPNVTAAETAGSTSRIVSSQQAPPHPLPTSAPHHGHPWPRVRQRRHPTRALLVNPPPPLPSPTPTKANTPSCTDLTPDLHATHNQGAQLQPAAPAWPRRRRQDPHVTHLQEATPREQHPIRASTSHPIHTLKYMCQPAARWACPGRSEKGALLCVLPSPVPPQFAS